MNQMVPISMLESNKMTKSPKWNLSELSQLPGYERNDPAKTQQKLSISSFCKPLAKNLNYVISTTVSSLSNTSYRKIKRSSNDLRLDRN